MPRYAFNDIIYNAIPHLDSIELCDRSWALGVHLGRVSEPQFPSCSRPSSPTCGNAFRFSPLLLRLLWTLRIQLLFLFLHSFYFYSIYKSFRWQCEYNSLISKIYSKSESNNVLKQDILISFLFWFFIQSFSWITFLLRKYIFAKILMNFPKNSLGMHLIFQDFTEIIHQNWEKIENI